MERLRSRSHQARALEWGLILLFILVLSWVLMGRFEALEERALRTIARYEYQLLQTRIQVYKFRHGEWPPTLREALGGEPGEILMVGENPQRSRLVDEQGRLINPFGRPYRYHADSGELEIPRRLARKSGSV